MSDLLKKYGTSRNGHAIFAPSSAKMWMQCPGSLLANFFAEDSAGVDAAIGTVAHDLAQICIQQGFEAAEALVGQTRKIKNGSNEFDITIDTDMLHLVEGYAVFCNSLSGDHFVETRVDLSFLFPIPDQGGTSDHFICNDGLLIVDDLKTGVIKVSANTEQLKLYASGIVNQWDWMYGFEKILLRIYQPGINHFDEHEMDIHELIEFEKEAEVAARKAWQPAAERRPSPDACRWCRDRFDCPARIQQVFELGQAILDDLPITPGAQAIGGDMETEVTSQRLNETLSGLTFPGVEAYKLSTPTLAKLVLWKDFVLGWFNAAYDELNSRITMEGETDPNWKIVPGRRSFSFKDEKLAREKLVRLGLTEDQLETRKLVSPNQAKTHLSAIGLRGQFAAALLGGVIKASKGRPTIVPMKDMRDPWATTGADMLEDLTETPEGDDEI